MTPHPGPLPREREKGKSALDPSPPPQGERDKSALDLSPLPQGEGQGEGEVKLSGNSRSGRWSCHTTGTYAQASGRRRGSVASSRSQRDCASGLA